MIINKFFDYVNEKGPFIIQTPWVGAIGNCAEEIYYGLLKARREGKKVVFLFPFNLFWKFKFSKTFINRELLKVKSDYRYDQFLMHLGNIFLTGIYTCIRIPVIFLRRFFRKAIPETYFIPDIGQSSLWKPANINYFSWKIAQSFEWEKQIAEYLPVKMPENSHSKARKIRIEMGIPENEWFVCLHVREGGFHGDIHGVSACRNASISNYIDGVKLITDKGGWVVRMGDSTMEPLPHMKQVIDYPHTPFKSNLMDIYLLSECSFYIGSASGIWDVAALFQKPMVAVNMIVWTQIFPIRKGDLGIIKHIYSRSRKRFLSLKEILKEPFECQYFLSVGNDYIYYENTPEEIYDLINEFLEKSEDYQYSPLQLEFSRRRFIQGQKILLNQVICNNHSDDVHNKYRIASNVIGCNGTIGRKFLEQNWEQSIMNKRGEYMLIRQ